MPPILVLQIYVSDRAISHPQSPSLKQHRGVSMADYLNPYGRFNTYQKPYPTRVISGKDILELGDEQQQHLIGHTIEYCGDMEDALNEALTKAEGYYNRLVELGDIIPEKTAEDLLKEQAEEQQKINETLLRTIQRLSDKLDTLENKNNPKSYADVIEVEGVVTDGNNGRSDERSEGSAARRGGKGKPGTKKIQP